MGSETFNPAGSPKVTQKRDDQRVKIDADPEDAIRALLKTPKRRVRSAASKKASDRKHD